MYIYIYIYPPTPAASRGSASEEALLATRGEEDAGKLAAGSAGKVSKWKVLECLKLVSR